MNCFANKMFPGVGGGCCCNFSTLVILILVILQFSKKRESSEECHKLVDDGILFIITLFYLSCCNPCRNM